MLNDLCWLCLVVAAVPAVLFLVNVRLYQPPREYLSRAQRVSISVLIPARDEEASIEASLAAALESRGVELEVIVLDDHSQDRTAEIVSAFAARDSRLSIHQAPALPEGWCGKQYACAALASLATKPTLVFLDADVRLAPDGLVRMADFLKNSGADLASGFPHQETGSLLEQMVIPLMHFVLLGFLPVRRMRTHPADPRLAAGCGQLFITRADAYAQMGGHATIRTTLHDGLKLPRAYRAAGLKTDLFDATEIATCRMYRNASDLWFGLAKNATEALATPVMIVPATLVLVLGQILPFILIFLVNRPADRMVVLLALVVSYVPRLVAVSRFRQPLLGAVLHPIGVVILLAIQWYALARDLRGRPATWKGRPYAARTG